MTFRLSHFKPTNAQCFIKHTVLQHTSSYFSGQLSVFNGQLDLLLLLLLLLLVLLLTYLLTHSTVQSPSWAADWLAASEEIPRISRNPKVHHRTHKHRHPSASWASPIQSTFPHPTSWRSILILSTHLRLGLPSGLLLTYLLTPWCRVLLEQLTGLQLVKKFPAFHGTRRFITATVSILGQPNPVHIPTSHLLEIHPNIIHPSSPRSPHVQV